MPETWLLAASGASQRREDLEAARGRCKVLTVNRTWELAPWADVLYSGDEIFWGENDTSGFEGRRIAGSAEVVGVDYLPVRAWLPACRRFSNSGTQALFLAPALGAGRVILTGYDMGGPHWHPDHPVKNPKAEQWPLWREGMRLAGVWLSALGIEVVNASRETALDCFPRVNLRAVL